jgi:Sulfotransferase family
MHTIKVCRAPTSLPLPQILGATLNRSDNLCSSTNIAASLFISQKLVAKVCKGSLGRTGRTIRTFFVMPKSWSGTLSRVNHKFAIARNPWDRVVSDYIYQKKKRSPRSARLCVVDERGNTRTFREWLEAVLADPFRFEPTQWGARVSQGIHRWSPQVDWISINGKIAVDSVLRMENLQKDFAELGSVLGLPSRQLPCRNWRFHAHYSHYHDDSTRRLVEKHYEKDIETFGYRFHSQGGNFQSVVPQRCGIRLKSFLSQLVQRG